VIERAARVIERLDRVESPLRRYVDRAANAAIADAPVGTPRIRHAVALSRCDGGRISSMIRYENDRCWVAAHLDGAKSREAPAEHFRE